LSLVSFIQSAIGLATMAILLVIAFGYLAYYGSSDDFIDEPYGMFLVSGAEISVFVFLVAGLYGVLYAQCQKRWPFVMPYVRKMGYLMALLIILACVVALNYFLSGRYRDGVDIVSGFMDMQLVWLTAGVVGTCLLIKLIYWFKATSERMQ
jgi:hypothetical protein